MSGPAITAQPSELHARLLDCTVTDSVLTLQLHQQLLVFPAGLQVAKDLLTRKSSPDQLPGTIFHTYAHI